MNMQFDLFDGLVKNALDFFKEALDDDQITNHPKYSLINFISGVELILKARLMHEHWTLILEDPAKADFNKFQLGDFKSANITTAIERIGNILNEKIKKQDLGQIEDIAKARNKILHFFDVSYLQLNNPNHQQKIQYVVKEQFRTWYRLYNLITKNWKDIFNTYSPQLLTINIKIHQNNIFLKTKLEEIYPKIEESMQHGFLLINCAACNFKTVHTGLTQSDLPFYKKNQCLLCDLSAYSLILNCDFCENLIIYRGDQDFVTCDCGLKLDPIAIINAEFHAEIDQYEDEHSSYRIYCSNCEEGTIAIDDSGQYVCLNCFEEFKLLEQCSGCGLPWACEADSLDNSYFAGCGLCHGHS